MHCVRNFLSFFQIFIYELHLFGNMNLVGWATRHNAKQFGSNEKIIHCSHFQIIMSTLCIIGVDRAAFLECRRQHEGKGWSHRGRHHQIKLWHIQFSKLSNPKVKQVYKRNKKHYLVFELLSKLVRKCLQMTIGCNFSANK